MVCCQEQLDDNASADVEEVEIIPVNLSLPLMKEVIAGWLVEMYEYLADNPSFIVKDLCVQEYVEHLMEVMILNQYQPAKQKVITT